MTDIGYFETLAGRSQITYSRQTKNRGKLVPDEDKIGSLQFEEQWARPGPKSTYAIPYSTEVACSFILILSETQ